MLSRARRAIVTAVLMADIDACVWLKSIGGVFVMRSDDDLYIVSILCCVVRKFAAKLLSGK